MSWVTDAMNAPAETASSFTNVAVCPSNLSRASIIASAVSTRPPGVFMSRITQSPFPTDFSPRRRM